MAKKALRISTSLSFPPAAVTQTFGILAIKDAGKTYLQMKMGEQFVKNRLPVTFIDSMGVCWGLRASADGKGPGLPITIFGGEHADLPLVPSAGKVVAELIAKENISCVLDISDFRKYEQKRFVMEFAEELYHIKKRYRDPLHLCMDETDLWAPQRPEKGYERLLGAIEDIVRRGRARGIGVTMATQRPAVVNKNVLSQISILIAMRMAAPQDIDAVDHWVKSNGTKEKRAKLLASLPELEKGEAWVWSPFWLKVFKKIKVSLRETYDSSRTPEIGEKVREPKKLAPVDIKKIAKAIEATVESQKQDDPKLLKKDVARLKMEVLRLQGEKQEAEERVTYYENEAAKPKAPTVNPAEIKALQDEIARLKKKKVQIVDRPLLPAKDLLRMEKIAQSLKTQGNKIADQAANIRGHADRMQKDAEGLDRRLKTQDALMETAKKAMEMPPPPVERPVQVVKTREGFRGHVAGRPTSMPPKDDIRLRAGERALLQSLYTLRGRATEAQVGALAGFPAGGSTFKTYRNVLIRNKLISVLELDGVNDLCLTALGEQYVPDTGQTAPRTTDEIVQLWNGRLRKGERDMLNFLVSVRGMRVPPATIMKEAGISSESTYKTYRNVLVRNKLAELFNDDQVSAHPTLFPRNAHA